MMMNPSEFEFKKPMVTFSVKKQYKRQYRDTHEIIYQILKTIEEREGMTAFYLRTECGLGIGYYPLMAFLKLLTNAMLISNEGKNYKARNVTCLKITDKGKQLLSKYDAYFSMIPDVWRSD